MVMSAYLLSSSNAAFTSLIVAPSLEVFDKIVWVALICVSYSWKPEIIGSMVSAFATLVPMPIALLVMLFKADMPTTPSVENLLDMLATVVDKLSKLLDILSKFKAFFKSSNDLILLLTPDSNCWLSNCILTTRWSTDVLIVCSPPSKRQMLLNQILFA